MSSHLFKRFEKLLFFAYLLLRSNVCFLFVECKSLHTQDKMKKTDIYLAATKDSVCLFSQVFL